MATPTSGTLSLNSERQQKASKKTRPSMWADLLNQEVIVVPIRGEDIIGTLVEVSLYELLLETESGPVLVSKGSIVAGRLS